MSRAFFQDALSIQLTKLLCCCEMPDGYDFIVGIIRKAAFAAGVSSALAGNEGRGVTHLHFGGATATPETLTYDVLDVIPDDAL